MSKLCCPMCWELFGIFNEGNEDESQLSFPGCHLIIYPVKLTDWLPTPIVDAITKKSKTDLKKVLEIIVAGAKSKKHHASHQSESNISVASTNRDGDDDDEFKGYDSES